MKIDFGIACFAIEVLKEMVTTKSRTFVKSERGIVTMTTTVYLASCVGREIILRILIPVSTVMKFMELTIM